MGPPINVSRNRYVTLTKLQKSMRALNVSSSPASITFSNKVVHKSDFAPETPARTLNSPRKLSREPLALGFMKPLSERRQRGPGGVQRKKNPIVVLQGSFYRGLACDPSLLDSLYIAFPVSQLSLTTIADAPCSFRRDAPGESVPRRDVFFPTSNIFVIIPGRLSHRYGGCIGSCRLRINANRVRVYAHLYTGMKLEGTRLTYAFHDEERV